MTSAPVRTVPSWMPLGLFWKGPARVAVTVSWAETLETAPITSARSKAGSRAGAGLDCGASVTMWDSRNPGDPCQTGIIHVQTKSCSSSSMDGAIAPSARETRSKWPGPRLGTGCGRVGRSQNDCCIGRRDAGTASRVDRGFAPVLRGAVVCVRRDCIGGEYRIDDETVDLTPPTIRRSLVNNKHLSRSSSC